jgi:hypothetical protein
MKVRIPDTPEVIYRLLERDNIPVFVAENIIGKIIRATVTSDGYQIKFPIPDHKGKARKACWNIASDCIEKVN